MKRIYAYMAISTFTITLLFSLSLNAADEGGTVYQKTIIGQVTSVGQQALTIQEDKTQTVYTLAASQDELKGVQTGYRVEVEMTESGTVSSLTILGMPMQVEPDPEQKWKVITYPGTGSAVSPGANPPPTPPISPRSSPATNP
ncbi:MAG TPA: hypothetical protein VLB01_03330 [Thermodesulfobacteriota bacterium]|nr:hypothetical protein [Thermodesulfobacteriota bacterium]